MPSPPLSDHYLSNNLQSLQASTTEHEAFTTLVMKDY